MFRLPGLIYRNKFGLPPPPPPGSFTDKSILITGATSGLGFAVALEYVKLGAKSVTITARTQVKGLTAKQAIEVQTGTTGKDIVKVMELDMSTFAGTKTFADKVKSEVQEIDVVLLNAGIFNTKWKIGEEGYEETIQVSVLSTTLLGLLLLPWMKKVGGGKAHLGFVTSGNHRRVSVKTWPKENILEHFSKEENWPAGNPNMYGLSKLLVQYAVREITKLSMSSNGSPEVIVNPMCPGMVKSELARQHKTNILTSLAIDAIMTFALKTPEGGARTLLYAAMTTPAENGKHITHYQTEEEYELAVEHNILGPEGQQMEAQVWKNICAILGEKVPEVQGMIHPL
ncbi:hypothetical protein G7Y89_g3116 [Cudoniella acicularis]|uniref:Uncharacterized protein n=1 Tax=Cudoniella acicularis TaxID=354080 RepID=A0A8H4RU34_9HELO|nr:hypothetical protein G7Y89_g3116 [Cudoniella acicularis]